MGRTNDTLLKNGWPVYYPACKDEYRPYIVEFTGDVRTVYKIVNTLAMLAVPSTGETVVPASVVVLAIHSGTELGSTPRSFPRLGSTGGCVS